MTTESFQDSRGGLSERADLRASGSNRDRVALRRLLDETHRMLVGSNSLHTTRKAVEDLVVGLWAIQQRNEQDAWVHDLAPECQDHPISRILLEDPYTRRALLKPRGFAGDAVMLDYIYDATPGSDVSPVGAEVFKATALTSSGRSVVERRKLLASRISATVAAKTGARVLSMACGHARELELLDARTQSELGEFLAVDQDEHALERIRSTQHGVPVRAVRGSVRDMIAGRIEASEIDFAYAAGLLDYLSDGVSRRLIRRLSESLAPGGRLLVGNFTPTNWGRGYMDAFMDWHLTYRTTTELREIGRSAGIGREIQVERVFEDRLGNVAYLELTVA